MAPSCVEPLPLYRPRNPQASGLWRVMDRHFATFQRVYDERFSAKYGFWKPIIERSVTAFLRCGDLHEGFARVRCGECGHEMFVAFSCKQRCTCPSCHQKRTLLTAIHVADAEQNHPADLAIDSPYLLELLPDRWALAHPASVRKGRVAERADALDAKRLRRVHARIEARAAQTAGA